MLADDLATALKDAATLLYSAAFPKTLTALPLEPRARYVCQEYLPRPLLVRGLKFDLRLYLLVVASDDMDSPDGESHLRFAAQLVKFLWEKKSTRAGP